MKYEERKSVNIYIYMYIYQRWVVQEVIELTTGKAHNQHVGDDGHSRKESENNVESTDICAGRDGEEKG